MTPAKSSTLASSTNNDSSLALADYFVSYLQNFSILLQGLVRGDQLFIKRFNDIILKLRVDSICVVLHKLFV